MESVMKLITFDRLLPLKGIQYSRDHLRRKVRAGEFPTPIQVSDHRVAWLEQEVDDWIVNRAAERPPGGKEGVLELSSKKGGKLP
jgi:prophage regulatory protein